MPGRAENAGNPRCDDGIGWSRADRSRHLERWLFRCTANCRPCCFLPSTWLGRLSLRHPTRQNYALKSMDEVYAKLEDGALYIERNPAVVKSITSFPYIVKSI
jgi:hypothetical protein